ncbi:MAG: hypothetical protein AAF146_10425 [Bacteroidota bacterium]
MKLTPEYGLAYWLAEWNGENLTGPPRAKNYQQSKKIELAELNADELRRFFDFLIEELCPPRYDQIVLEVCSVTYSKIVEVTDVSTIVYRLCIFELHEVSDYSEEFYLAVPALHQKIKVIKNDLW